VGSRAKLFPGLSPLELASLARSPPTWLTTATASHAPALSQPSPAPSRIAPQVVALMSAHFHRQTVLVSLPTQAAMPFVTIPPSQPPSGTRSPHAHHRPTRRFACSLPPARALCSRSGTPSSLEFAASSTCPPVTPFPSLCCLVPTSVKARLPRLLVSRALALSMPQLRQPKLSPSKVRFRVLQVLLSLPLLAQACVLLARCCLPTLPSFLRWCFF